VSASRLDKLLVERGLAESRERARALILAGRVFVGGHRVDKAGRAVDGDAEIELRGIDPAGMNCLDVGVSTGGFTDCLLSRGAVRVVGVDVGYGQLAWKLRCDERVVVHERTNARTLTPELVGGKVDLAVIDVSFISLKLILPPVAACICREGGILALVKPQFEVGKGKVGSGGVVRDEPLRMEAVASVRAFGSGEAGLFDLGFVESPITGPKGNHEYFVRFKKSGVRAS